uniref:Uncharacterized protein n=1 Tax=Solanum lycopersicum TaxID=4081 RepID=A0A494G9A5_SOLLC
MARRFFWIRPVRSHWRRRRPAKALLRQFQLGFHGETVNLPLPGRGDLQGTRVLGQRQPAGLHEQLQQRRSERAAQVRTPLAPVRTGARHLGLAMGQGLDEYAAVRQLCRPLECHHHALFDLFDPAGIEQALVQISGQRATQMVIAKTRAQQRRRCGL